MATVNLKKDWFGPDGTLYLVRDNPHTFPASYDEKLPSTAQAVAAQALDEDDEDKPAPKPVKK